MACVYRNLKYRYKIKLDLKKLKRKQKKSYGVGTNDFEYDAYGFGTNQQYMLAYITNAKNFHETLQKKKKKTEAMQNEENIYTLHSLTTKC